MRREDTIEGEAYLICDDWNNKLRNISAINICLQFQIYNRVLQQNKGRSYKEGCYSYTLLDAEKETSDSLSNISAQTLDSRVCSVVSTMTRK